MLPLSCGPVGTDLRSVRLPTPGRQAGQTGGPSPRSGPPGRRTERRGIAMNPIHLTTILLTFGASAAHAQWQSQKIDTDADFRGLCAVSDKVAWVSGTRGTF